MLNFICRCSEWCKILAYIDTHTYIRIYGWLSALTVHAHTLWAPPTAQPTTCGTSEGTIVLRLRAGQWLYRELRASAQTKGKGTSSEYCNYLWPFSEIMPNRVASSTNRFSSSSFPATPPMRNVAFILLRSAESMAQLHIRVTQWINCY